MFLGAPDWEKYIKNTVGLDMVLGAPDWDRYIKKCGGVKHAYGLS